MLKSNYTSIVTLDIIITYFFLKIFTWSDFLSKWLTKEESIYYFCLRLFWSMVYYKVLFVTFADFKNISFTTAWTGFFYETLLNTCMSEMFYVVLLQMPPKKKISFKKCISVKKKFVVIQIHLLQKMNVYTCSESKYKDKFSYTHTVWYLHM